MSVNRSTWKNPSYPFSFSGERLALYPDEFSSQSLQEFFAPFERGNTIKDIELNGITANRKKVVFEVSEQYSDEEGFLSFNVYSIYEYDSLYYQFYTEDGKQKYHGDIIILLYHEDMMSVRELLFKNSQKEKTSVRVFR